MCSKTIMYIILIGLVCVGAAIAYGYKYTKPTQREHVSSGPSSGKVTSEKVANVKDQVVRLRFKNEQIYGHLYSPKHSTQKKLPVAIVSHGLGGNYQELAGYARQLARHGYLAYAFDFPGGSSGGESSGVSQTEMSIYTEARDLLGVINALTQRQDAQTGKVLLVGGSQGAVVSALLASQHPEKIRALALMYPAFSITHDAQRKYRSMKSVPATTNVFGFTVGRSYYRGLLKTNITKSATQFTGPVLLVHGGNDDIVPIKFAREAAQNFKNAQFHELPTAGHGFEGVDQKKAYRLLDKFTEKLN
ncbi:alpha/beta hydrolase family protein [Levilactobacillus hammesii]|uniref:alpha/beta hydrolase family protein n=1 Tax=Levilactobacillus hammesii TaxID=267633 RepID=UPI0009F8CE3C|nr:alpha/beta fold hydrolase [Levilactobacillus hammesii]